MKSKWAILGILGAGALAVGGYFAGDATAQNNPPASPSVMGRTRIGFVNLHEVLKNYKKYTGLRDQLKAKDEQFVQILKVKQTRVDELLKEGRDPKTPAPRKEQLEAEIKQLQFDMQNIKNDAEKTLVKFHNENVAQIYREVYAVVQEYAEKNQIDIVMRFNEDWGDGYHEPAKVVARMSVPFFPMYYHTSLEMTGPVRDTLNARYAAAAAPAAGANPIVPTGGSGAKK